MFSNIYTRIKFYLCFLHEKNSPKPLLYDSVNDEDIYKTIDL